MSCVTAAGLVNGIHRAVHEIGPVTAVHVDVNKPRRDVTTASIDPFVGRRQSPRTPTHLPYAPALAQDNPVGHQPVGQHDDTVVETETQNR